MIITDLQYRMVGNLQDGTTGTTEYNTTTRVYKISGDTASGYHASLVLPAMPYMASIQVEFAARVSSGDTATAEIHTHNSPYYGATYNTADRAVIENSDDWKFYQLRTTMTSRSGRVYPRIDFGTDGIGDLEIRNAFIRVEFEGDIRLTELDRKLREKWFGPKFSAHQGITSTTTGSGAITLDAVAANYTEYAATGTDTAFDTIDDFEGFEVNQNTEFYVVEIDARVPVQAKEAVARFVFKDAVGGDTHLQLNLTQTTDSGSSASYQTYKFFVVQDGFPLVIDSVELEIGSMATFQTTHRIREVRIRSYGLTTSDLKPIGIDSTAAIVFTGGVPAFDDNYRRENLDNVTTDGASTIKMDIPYRAGKLMCPVGSSLASDLIPVPKSVTATVLKFEFRDAAGSVVALASIPDGYTFFIKAES